MNFARFSSSCVLIERLYLLFPFFEGKILSVIMFEIVSNFMEKFVLLYITFKHLACL